MKKKTQANLCYLNTSGVFARRIAVSFLSLLLILPTTPLPPIDAAQQSSKKVAQPPKNNTPIRKGQHKLSPVSAVRKFSSNPTDLEISTARVFLEPLIPMSSQPVAGENLAIASAIDTFKSRKALDDISAFTTFLSNYPHSRWRASIEQNLGNDRFRQGYLSQALKYWQSAWELSKSESKRPQRDVADTAVSELLMLNARVGRMDDLEKYFAQIEKRQILGSNEERVVSAREGLKRMREKPSEAFKCGPFAIDSILYRHEKSAKRSDVAEKAQSTREGTNLAQVNEIAKQVGLKLQAAKKSVGADFVVPSVIHWKLSHFAAITDSKNGLYHVKDPTFGSAGETWLTAKALDAETDGYSLVPDGKLPSGWTAIDKNESEKVWGRGGAGGFNGNWPGRLRGPAVPTYVPADGRYGISYPSEILNYMRGNDDDDSEDCKQVDCGDGVIHDLDAEPLLSECPGACDSCGMAVPSDRVEECTLNISDTPLSYTPPIGPPIDIHLNYAWLETNQPSTYTFTNFGQNWTSRWLSYLTVDPTTQAITLRRPSGGSEVYTKDPISGLYTPNFIVHDTMLDLGGGAYQSTSVEGWVAKYTLSDTSSPPRIFMTEIKDPQGNSALIQYDSDFRITTVTDAISQVTTFSYLSNVLGNPGFYKVATITDPFSRTAQFQYDTTSTFLLSITDAMGMKSEFIYDPTSSFISALTTPYGTTSFIAYTPPNSNGSIARGLRKIFPDGTSNVVENWIPHINKSYFWDRNATKLYPNDPINRDYSHCKTRKLCYDAATNLLEPVLNYIQSPLESPQYYQYPGQSITDYTGSSNRPENVYQSLGNQLVIATVGGTKTTGDILNITVYDNALPSGSQSINYTVQSGDNLNTITAGLASAMNGNSNLKNIGLRATSSLTTIGLTSQSSSSTTYTKSTSGGATETLVLTPGTKQFAQLTFSGSAVAEETVAVWIALPSGWNYISYTIQSGDTLANVATALAAAITANATMIANEVSATASGSSVNITALQIGLIQITPAGSWHALLKTDYLKNGTFNFRNREYNELGLVTKTIDSTGRTFKYIYDTNKIDLLEVREITNGDNYLIDYFEYNANHQVTKHIDGSGQQTLITYNAQGQPLTTTDALGNVTTNTYTGNYLTSVNGPLAGNADVTTMSYDSVGRLYQTTDSEGYTLTFLYDNLNRLTETLFPDGTTSKKIFDRLNAVMTKDRLDRWTQSAYNNMGEVEYTVDSAGRKTKFEWCTCGAMAALIDPKGQKTTWHHDVRGRTIEKTYADGTQVKFDYDPLSGRLLSKTDALGQKTFFNYFSDDSPFQTEYIDAINPTSSVTTFYDQKFNRVSSVQSQWGVTSYTYNNYITNPAGTPITGGGALQLIHNNVIPNSDITFQYDALGRVTNRDIDGASNASSWTFDAISRVTAETNALGTFNYSYVDNTPGSSKGLSRLASVAYPNGQSTIFDWYGNDNDNRLRGITHLTPGGTTRSQFNYAHNPGGEIVRWAQQNAGLTPQVSNIGYDKVSQLTTSVAGDGSASAPYSNQYFYGYDPASNRTAVQTVNVETARIGGSVSTGDTLTITVKNDALTGGQKAISYITQSGDTLNVVAAQLAAAISADTDMQAIGVNAVSGTSVVSIKSVSSSVTTYSQSTNGGATETITLGVSRNAIQNLTVQGTATASDVVTLTVYDSSLAGGSRAATYTVASGNTLANIASGLASSVNADSVLTAAGITATAASTTVSVKSTSTNLTTYKGAVSSGATEKVSLAMNMNGAETIVIGGSKTTGDVLTLHVYDQGLSGGKRSVSHTVLSGDTLSSITSSLASAINGDSQLQAIGVTASSTGTLLTVNSVSFYTTTYTTARSAGATETITPGINPNGVQTAVIGGSKTTGNVLTITVFDSGLAGGSKAVNYTVLSGDTLTSIAAGISTAINADSALTSIGVTATSVNTVVNIKSASIHATTYSQSLSSGATETITLAKGIGTTQAAHNNVNQVTNISAGGATRFTGVTNKAIKSAAVSSQAITISSTAASATSFSSSLVGVPQETASFDTSTQRENGQTILNLGGTPTPGDVFYLSVRGAVLPGGQQVVSYTVKSGDSLGSIAYGLYLAIVGNQFLYNAGYGGFTSGSSFYIQSPLGSWHNMSSTYSCTIAGKPTESLTLGSNTNGSTTATISGTTTVGDVVSIKVNNDNPPGGSQTVSRTVQSGDTTSTIASALSSSINGNSNLASIGMTAGASTSVVTITTAGTTYSSSTSGGATETVTLGYNSQGNTVAIIGGTKTTGDVLTITTNSASLGGGTSNSSYTVQSGDTLVSIAAGLSAAINSNANLQTLGVSASSNTEAELAYATHFSANPALPAGSSTAAVAATDGANNTKTVLQQNHVGSPSSQTLTFDLNGNMTSDGTNTYKWDAANRLIEIDYPGANNRTEFTFDTLGQCAKIIEVVGGINTSLYQFIWNTDKASEQRDASGAILKKFFRLGEMHASTAYFYCTDHLGSVRQVIDAAGNVQAELQYDAFGRVSSNLGNVSPTFQFASYFAHVRSSLNLTLRRAYSPNLGAWLSRDPLGQVISANDYSYVFENPISFVDSFGLFYGIPVPPNASVDANIKEAEGHPRDLNWIYNQVRLGGPWDYKQRGKQYEAFGNFNYGAIAHAACLQLETALRAAGFANQAARPENNPLGRGSFWIHPKPYINAAGKFPFGDDYQDSWWIIQGYQSYRPKNQCCKEWL
ncbi:MAG: hypothetical protein DKT66_18200 [Candidatus Melainabacteria bacterium]|nr:MAG: hypothetical protein DKT66_18200 [Candidatus Melainabacteria bacterium]